MNTPNLKQIGFVFILIAILVVTFGTENISYAQEAAPTLTASVEAPLTEATLHGSVVTLTLSGRSFGHSSELGDALTVTGIEGVTLTSSSIWEWEWVEVDRVSNTQIRIELSFDGTDFDTDATLTFTVGADGIEKYGESLTAQLPVTAIKQSNATVRLSPDPVVSAPIGEAFTVNLNITGGERVAGFQATVAFDEDTLLYVESAKGDYLPEDAFFKFETVSSEVSRVLSLLGGLSELSDVLITAAALEGVSNGNGTLATLTFEVIDVIASTMPLSDVYLVDREGILWEVEIQGTEIVEPAHDIVGDINRDGVVNIRDLTLVSFRFGQRGDNRADLNGDDIVDIADLVLAANAIGADAAAPALNPQVLEHLTAADVKAWLTQAQQLTRTDPAYLRGIRVLEQLLAALTPKQTALLANFPNPFNPETWIPYHLSKNADVTLHIYAVNGILVRTLALGHQPPGRYQSRSRAAYWDGRNDAGEPVASGVYFYTLTAGAFSATRKLLIRK